MNLEPNHARIWTSFLKRRRLPLSTPFYEVFTFGLDPSVSDELVELVRQGKKRATASAIPSFIDRLPPQAGDYSLLTDHSGVAVAIIQTQRTLTLPFNQFTYDIVKDEGEDETLLSWQANHRKFFLEEGALMGYHFSDDMPVLFEWFEVVEYME